MLEGTMKRTSIAGFAAALLLAGAAQAQTPDTIKIGVLADMSSLYADLGGPGSVVATQMAVADFGGTVRRSRSSAPTIRTSPMSLRRSPASGSMSRACR
jgi:hypothetical protein